MQGGRGDGRLGLAGFRHGVECYGRHVAGGNNVAGALIDAVLLDVGFLLGVVVEQGLRAGIGAPIAGNAVVEVGNVAGAVGHGDDEGRRNGHLAYTCGVYAEGRGNEWPHAECPVNFYGTRENTANTANYRVWSE